MPTKSECVNRNWLYAARPIATARAVCPGARCVRLSSEPQYAVHLFVLYVSLYAPVEGLSFLNAQSVNFQRLMAEKHAC
jgi:hypothetical protein